eukprot:COSAG02_NODE_2733_length_8136_cov_35.604454_3_plen_50_part_00
MNSALPEFLTIMQDPNTESVARACRARDCAGIASVADERATSRYWNSVL